MPAPLGPMSPRISPLLISKLTWLTATSPPNCLRASRTASSGCAGGDLLARRQPRLAVDLARRARRQQPLHQRPDAVAGVAQQDHDQHAEHDDLEGPGLPDQAGQRRLQHLLEDGDQERPQHGAPDVAGAADHRHEQVLDAHVDGERRRIDEALHVREQPAGKRRQHGSEDEHLDAQPRRHDAEGFRHRGPPLQRADRTAGARIEQIGARPQREQA